jgi:diadenylate cyclase
MTLPFEIRWIDFVDILIVATLLYYILLWLRGTRAIPLIRGLILVLLVYLAGPIGSLISLWQSLRSCL